MSKTYPACPMIYKTTDYSIFNKIEWNRAIDKNNFQKLLKENQKLFQLHKFPIIVTKDYKIIDGQHRFEVSKKLKSPVYFIVDGEDFSFSMVHSVNKAGKKHTLKDKIEMLYKAGDPGATIIYDTFKTFDMKFDVGTVASMLMTGSTGGSINSMIDNKGKIQLLNYDQGMKILFLCSTLNLQEKFSNRVVFSLNAICKIIKKKPEIIVQQINKNIFLWTNPRTRETVMDNLIKCYNYNLKESNKIKRY